MLGMASKLRFLILLPLPNIRDKKGKYISGFEIHVLGRQNYAKIRGSHCVKRCVLGMRKEALSTHIKHSTTIASQPGTYDNKATIAIEIDNTQ